MEHSLTHNPSGVNLFQNLGTPTKCECESNKTVGELISLSVSWPAIYTLRKHDHPK